MAAAQPFIAVFRPHQRPAWVQAFESEQDFVDAWEGGRFAAACNAFGPEGDEPVTFANAWRDVGHDLHGLDRIDSAEEVTAYLKCHRHNRPDSKVIAVARELGWLPEEDEDECVISVIIED